jgi:hypothetical protein
MAKINCVFENINDTLLAIFCEKRIKSNRRMSLFFWFLKISEIHLWLFYWKYSLQNNQMISNTMENSRYSGIIT